MDDGDGRASDRLRAVALTPADKETSLQHRIKRQRCHLICLARTHAYGKAQERVEKGGKGGGFGSRPRLQNIHFDAKIADFAGLTSPYRLTTLHRCCTAIRAKPKIIRRIEENKSLIINGCCTAHQFDIMDMITFSLRYEGDFAD